MIRCDFSGYPSPLERTAHRQLSESNNDFAFDRCTVANLEEVSVSESWYKLLGSDPELIFVAREGSDHRQLAFVTVSMKAIQLRMARAAVGWGVRELTKKAGVTANTVTRIENGADAKQSTVDRLRSALEAAGVEFTNGDQPGARLAKTAAGSADTAGASKPAVAAKTVSGRTAKATEKRR